MSLIKTAYLLDASTRLLMSWGVPQLQAQLIADTIVYAHTHEKHTHGITRLPIYKQKIDNGLMSSNTKVDLILEKGAISVLDCNDGFGQVVGEDAVKRAVEQAKQFGIGAVFVRNSNNFGVEGYFGDMIANAGMYGCVLTASAPAIAPEGGTRSIFGTNPICCAFPTPEGNVVLDMAVSAAARGKIRLAQKNGEKIPFGWAVDASGNPTDDPSKALLGNMIAIGGVKGFGLAMMVDFLAGMLSGSAFGGDIKPLATENALSRHGHCFLAIDIKALMSEDEYEKKVRTFIHNVKACGEDGKISLPGERSRIKSEKNKDEVEIKDKQLEDYFALLKQYHCL